MGFEVRIGVVELCVGIEAGGGGGRRGGGGGVWHVRVVVVFIWFFFVVGCEFVGREVDL